MTPNAKGSSRPTGRKLALPVWKQILFIVILVGLFFGLLEGLLALFHVQPIVATEDPYVGFTSVLPLYVEEKQPNGSTLMVTAKNKLAYFNPQEFPRKKPRNGYRIFSLGESTTFGNPYDDRTSYSAWLREILPRTDPSRSWEVINAGGVSYASYRIAALMEELQRYEPDLFIVYVGQNEFLERRTYRGIIEAHPSVTWLDAMASRTRIYALLHAALASVRPDRTREARKQFEMTGEVDALLDVAGGLSIYSRDDAQQRQITDHYAFNLHRMMRIARAAGASIVFVAPASNLKNCSPFKSQHSEGLSPAAIARCDSLLRLGREAAGASDLTRAATVLREAASLDPRFAETQYRLGQVELAMGDATRAAASFQRALDEDVCPLRQPSVLRAALLDFAQQEQVPIIDFPGMLQDSTLVQTGNRILGEEYFLDHVHPSIAGHRMLAMAIVERMITDGIVRPAAGWRDNALRAATRDIESRLDRSLQVRGLRNLTMIFNWAGKTEESLRLSQRIRELDAHDEVSLILLGRQASNAGRSDEAIQLFRQALAANAANPEARCNLAIELARQGKHEEAIAEYREVLETWSDKWLVHIDIAYSYLKLKQFDQALDHYEKVVALRPDDPRALITLAAAYAEAQRVDDAVRTTEKAIGMARANGQAPMANALQSMLAEYRSGKPWDARLAIRQP